MVALRFAACYVYSPTGVGVASRRSRLMRTLLKCADPGIMCRYAQRVRSEADDGGVFTDVFDNESLLVPIPGSTPSGNCSAWASTRLANALISAGLGATCWPGLQRTGVLRKSSAAPPGSRPSVAEHRLSLQVERSDPPPRQILLIDDVVSRGRTLFAAALCMREAFPTAEIRAFALLRTLGLLPEIERLLDPCVGEIRWRHGDVHRSP